FIDNASSKALGGVGGLFLLVSAVSLLNNIERSLNEIWGVSRKRPLLQRVLIYWCALTLGPIALGFSLVATGVVQAVAGQLGLGSSLLTMLPLVTSVLLLAFLYIAAPNAKVSFRAALGGGLVAGVAWEIAKHGYALYAARSIQYSAIYGSLGAIPLFLVWVYVSWLLVLFGARLAYALQFAAGRISHVALTDPRGREILCVRVAVEAAAAFVGREPPPTPARLAKRIGVDETVVVEAVRVLLEGGLLAETTEGGVVPTRAPDAISLLDVAKAANGTLFGHAASVPSTEPLLREIAAAFEGLDAAGRETLARSSLASLLAPGATVRAAAS
ncbi:MAG: YihY family inner membrane protein, partial [Myxococcales bacterium]